MNKIAKINSEKKNVDD